jgi:hypothetical protein
MNPDLLEKIYLDMRAFNVMAQDIAKFGESAHMAAILDGTYDHDHPRVSTQVIVFSFHSVPMTPTDMSTATAICL